MKYKIKLIYRRSINILFDLKDNNERQHLSRIIIKDNMDIIMIFETKLDEILKAGEF